ncbi:MAG: MAPEG family protein [Rhizomicrobium sp.]
MNFFTGSIEIQMLCWSVVLGLAQLVIATSLATKDQGLAYNISPRDAAPPPVTQLTSRFQRAFGNFRETFVYFAVAVLVVTALAKGNSTSALGAQIYFWSRLAYVPVYAAGITGLRTVLWTVSVVGLVMVLLAAAA